jgi:hypothetical protein
MGTGLVASGIAGHGRIGTTILAVPLWGMEV